MEKLYITPEMDITEFDAEDIIVTSPPFDSSSDDNDPTLPRVPIR